jgi:hypothetical protein
VKADKPSIIRHNGKGSVVLPHKDAVAQLLGGSLEQRSLNNYAKLTPNIVHNGPSINDRETDQ